MIDGGKTRYGVEHPGCRWLGYVDQRMQGTARCVWTFGFCMGATWNPVNECFSLLLLLSVVRGDGSLTGQGTDSVVAES